MLIKLRIQQILIDIQHRKTKLTKTQMQQVLEKDTISGCELLSSLYLHEVYVQLLFHLRISIFLQVSTSDSQRESWRTTTTVVPFQYRVVNCCVAAVTDNVHILVEISSTIFRNILLSAVDSFESF